MIFESRIMFPNEKLCLGIFDACDCIKLVSVYRISDSKVRVKIVSSRVTWIFFYLYSPPCLLGNFPLISKRTQEKKDSIAFNMHIFVFIHVCDCFKFASVYRISHTKVRIKIVSSLVTRKFFICILHHVYLVISH
jgi:hypothetical protein